MWLGSMAQNSGFKNNILPVLTKEIEDNSIPNQLYMEYIGGNALQTFGVVIHTGGNSALRDIQRAVENCIANSITHVMKIIIIHENQQAQYSTDTILNISNTVILSSIRR